MKRVTWEKPPMGSAPGLPDSSWAPYSEHLTCGSLALPHACVDHCLMPLREATFLGTGSCVHLGGGPFVSWSPPSGSLGLSMPPWVISYLSKNARGVGLLTQRKPPHVPGTASLAVLSHGIQFICPR